jgi:hypothetical protein
MSTFFITFTLYPVARNSVWEAIFGIPFERAVKVCEIPFISQSHDFRIMCINFVNGYQGDSENFLVDVLGSTIGSWACSPGWL